MGSILGKEKKSSRITDQDQAILKLKKQRDQLKQYQKRIYDILEKDRLLARQLLQEGKKDRAKLLLRKKKYQEGLLARTDAQLNNLEQLTHDLEFAQVQKQVLQGLSEGNEALKKANAMFSIEEIESIMDDTREAMEKQREIDALLSGQLTSDEEDDVLRELDELVATAEAEEEAQLRLPDAPQEELLEEKKEKAKKSKGAEKVAVAAS